MLILGVGQHAGSHLPVVRGWPACPLVLSVFGGLSSFLAEGDAGDIAGGAAAGDALVSLVMTLVRVPQVGFGFG